ncbi:MAG: hypothetical protein HRT89_10205 [Lentisphaeria bacterium]|nr:hypothetical protein [Lentisphaeria bacterium]NQZ68429.1 hypothetical protein [Lentisphaeria bacterium]
MSDGKIRKLPIIILLLIIVSWIIIWIFLSLHIAVKIGLTILVPFVYICLPVIIAVFIIRKKRGEEEEKEKEFTPEEATKIIRAMTEMIPGIISDYSGELTEVIMSSEPLRQIANEGKHDPEFVKENLQIYIQAADFYEENFVMPKGITAQHPMHSMYSITNTSIYLYEILIKFQTGEGLDYLVSEMKQNKHNKNDHWPEMFAEIQEDRNLAWPIVSRLGTFLPDNYAGVGYLEMLNNLVMTGQIGNDEHPFNNQAGYEKLKAWISGTNAAFALSAGTIIPFLDNGEHVSELIEISDNYDDPNVYIHTLWVKVMCEVDPTDSLKALLTFTLQGDSDELKRYAAIMLVDPLLIEKVIGFCESDDQELAEASTSLLTYLKEQDVI